MTISSFVLKGHKCAINCLDYNDNQNDQPLLLSGSDDKTARIWDLRTSKAAICIRTKNSPVTSAIFGDAAKEKTITVEEKYAMNLSVFLGTEDNTILEYDLRQIQTPIVSEPIRDLTESFQLEEEVSQISFSKGRIATADDSGAVRVWDGDKLRIMQDENAPPLLMTCCGFRRSSEQLVSGGTDCTLYYWDIGKPRKPLDSMCFPRDDTSVNQVCNPPMVHTLAWSPSGRLCATGLGDGTISVVTVIKKKLVHLARLRNGHSDSVASLCFPNFGGGRFRKKNVSDDRLLASIGTDGLIFIWDLQRNVGGKTAMDPLNVLSNELLREEEEDTNAEERAAKEDPKILFGIPHRQKGNWMVTNEINTLFVADTTNEITGYNIPLQG